MERSRPCLALRARGPALRRRRSRGEMADTISPIAGVLGLVAITCTLDSCGQLRW